MKDVTEVRVARRVRLFCNTIVGRPMSVSETAWRGSVVKTVNVSKHLSTMGPRTKKQAVNRSIMIGSIGRLLFTRKE